MVLAVILSEAKDLADRARRSFASLRMTGLLSKRLTPGGDWTRAMGNADIRRVIEREEEHDARRGLDEGMSNADICCVIEQGGI